MIRFKPLLNALIALVALSVAVTVQGRGPHSGLSDGIKAVPIAGKLAGEVGFVPFFPAEPASENGWAEFSTPAGDTIYGTYESFPLVPPPMQIGDPIIQEGVIQIVGGTGSFAGATGQLAFRVYVVFEGLGDPFWPLEYVVSGLIHVPE